METDAHKNGQAQRLLDAFCRHQNLLNPGTDLTHAGHWDGAVLLTGYVLSISLFIESLPKLAPMNDLISD